MANEINKAFVQQFSDNLIIQAQQKGSRLLPTVTVKQVVGKYAHFDRLNKTAATVRTTRHSTTPIVDSQHSRRRLVLADYEWGEAVDDQDELRMLIDPKSAYAEAGANALGRAIDDVIIAAAVGNARSIDSDDASSNVTILAANVVDEDFITTNSNLTVRKLIEARRILMAADVDMNEEIFCVANASAIASLLTETQTTSADYNSVKALVNGEIDTFLGFKFIRSERLTTSASEGFTQVLVYTKSAIGLGIGQDISVKMAEDPSLSFATRIYATMTLGAVRIEEEKVVVIECVQ